MQFLKNSKVICVILARNKHHLQKYIQNSITLTNQEKKNADVNADGSINNTDVNLLSSYISSSSYKADGFPPNEPLK